MLRLDEIDVRILEILQKEGRISTVQLSDRVGLSGTPCARRVKRLEKEGVIERYVALVNPKYVGRNFSAFVNVRLKNSTRQSNDIFEKAIRNMPEVVACYSVTGKFDYLLHVRVADVAMFRDFVLERLATIPSVSEHISDIVLEQTKYVTAIPLSSGARKLKQ